MKIEYQIGPQAKFLGSPASIAIFGGGAGGGKSYALLLEMLRHYENSKFSGIIFRRNSTQIRNPGGLWTTSMELYTSLGCTPKQAFLEWQFPSGATLKMAHLENADTVYSYQGAQIPLICCEENEKIMMGDGKFKKIKDLTLGDEVKTLTGKKRIKWIGNRRLEQCVLARVKDKVQVHSLTHKILTSSGWVSYNDKYKFDESHLSLISLPKLSYFFYRFGLLSSKILRGVELLLGIPFSNQLPKFSLWKLTLEYLNSLEIFSYKVLQDLGNYFGLSRYVFLKLERPPSIHLNAVRFLQSPSIKDYGFSPVSISDEAPCVGIVSKFVNYLFRYFSDFHLSGEFAFSIPDSNPNVSLLLNDVEEQSQKDLLSDDRDRVQKYNSHKLQYAHPYRNTLQSVEVEHEFVPCELTPCGKRWVKDITVEDDSHYITESGLVNKNCFDELTHFEESQFWYMLSRLRSMSGVPGYVRATTNPDIGWVRDLISWWLNEEGYPIQERSGILRWFIRQNDSLIWADTREELIQNYGDAQIPKSLTFIPSLVKDNKILMEKDPSYLSNLMALARVDRMRLLEGNWNVRPTAGNFFRREWMPIVDVVPGGWIQAIRYWDRAATKPNESNKDPDWTRGVKLFKYPDNSFCVADLRSLRDTPGQVEKMIKNVAGHDGQSIRIMSQQDPGSAGVAEADNFTRMLIGYDVRVETMSKDKATRAKPVSAQCEAGNIRVVRAPWNEEFFNEIENFPTDGIHDDIVDSFSAAFNAMSHGLSTADAMWR